MTDNKFKYPRVSEILEACGASKDLSLIDPLVVANAAQRGTKVHEYCAAYIEDEWLPELEEECLPYFESFKLWFDEEVAKVHLNHKRFFHEELKYTGEIDLLVTLKGGATALVDLKTSSTPSKSWPIQLAAYGKLLELEGFEVFSLVNVHLKKTGKVPKVITYEDSTIYWKVFECNLVTFDYFHRETWEKEALHVHAA